MFGGVAPGHMSGQLLGSEERLPAVLTCEHVDAIGVHITPVRMEIVARSIHHGAQVAGKGAHVVARGCGANVIHQTALRAAESMASRAHGNLGRRHHAELRRTLPINRRAGRRRRSGSHTNTLANSRPPTHLAHSDVVFALLLATAAPTLVTVGDALLRSQLHPLLLH
jgi:hypothetical protein